MSNFSIAWLRSSDYESVAEIEQLVFQDAWTKEEIKKVLDEDNVYAVCAEFDGEILGYIFYRTNIHSYTILNVAVRPKHQRKGIGKKLLQRLFFKAISNGKRYLKVYVSEMNKDGQLFFQYLGFRATNVYKNFYDNGLDAYYMIYDVSKYTPTESE